MNLTIKKRSSYYSVIFSSGNTITESDLLNDEELTSILKAMHSEIIGAISKEDHDWWIESIQDEIVRAGYKLVKEED